MRSITLCCFAILALLPVPAKTQATSETPLEAAPGVPLPAKGGIYALDHGSKTMLLKLGASELLLNRHTGSNIAKSAFYVGSRQTLEISGLTAKTVIESTEVTFFIHLNPDEPTLQLNRITLLHLENGEKSRILAALDANVWGGGAKRKLQAVEVSKQTLPGDEWVKVTPTQKLTPGQYAITILPKDPKLFPDTAFDFSIAGTAP